MNDVAATATLPANPFLTGVYTPMKAELTIEEMAGSGEIPSALEGAICASVRTPWRGAPA